VAKKNVHTLEDIVNIHYANVDHASGDLDSAIARLQIYYDRYNADRNVRDTVLYGLDLAEWLAEARRHDEAYRVLKNCSELQRSVYDQEIERTTQVSALRSKLDVERESVRQRDEARTAIAHRLMAGERKIGERVASASILFADIVGFTQMSASMEPELLVDLLEELFAKMDDISLAYGCERIKTIGDSYMAACGLAGDHADHTERLCRAALAIVDEASHLPLTPSQFRIGIHSGPVVAGVMSGSKLSYDIWGDTVNVASRMEKHSAPGRILCSSDAAANIMHTPDFVLKEREPLDIRGKGLMTTFWLSHR
jgi:class 3 adenylate cyclase